MNKIICPSCEKAHIIDEAGYSNVLNRVRNNELENDLSESKDFFTSNYGFVNRMPQHASGDFANPIRALENTKTSLIGSEKNLKLTNSRAEDISIRKLSNGNPTLSTKFAELIADSSDQSTEINDQ